MCCLCLYNVHKYTHIMATVTSMNNMKQSNWDNLVHVNVLFVLMHFYLFKRKQHCFQISIEISTKEGIVWKYVMPQSRGSGKEFSVKSKLGVHSDAIDKNKRVHIK